MKDMKRNIFMVAAVALLVMVSCNKEENNVDGSQVTPPSYYIDFTVSISNEDAYHLQQAPSTRTTLSEGKTQWLEDDLIAINGKKFKVVEFLDNGQARISNIEELGTDFKEPYTAVYPYNETLNTTVVPNEQTLTAGTFADETVVAVAYSESEKSLSFKHVSTYLRFTVATEGLTELEFTSAGNIAGTITVDAKDGGEPTYEVTSGEKTITAKSANGPFVVGESYYISVLPTLGAADVKQKLEIKSEGVTIKSGNVRFKRNVPAKVENLKVDYVYLKPNVYWKTDNSRFATYFFKSETEYVWTNAVDEDSDGIYRTVIPEGYTNLIFCRMSPSSTNNDWPAWNQTEDLVTTNNISKCYVMHADEWTIGGWFNTNDAKRILYLFPTNTWDKDNARFAAYFFGKDPTKWENMTKYSTYKYYVVPPSGYTNVIFCRMNGSESINDWPNKWNQTKDLTIPNDGKNTCTISNHWAETATGSWSKK